MKSADRRLLADLTAAFLAKGRSVTVVPAAERPTAESLARTRAEQFFRNINVRSMRPKPDQGYVGK